MTKKNHRDAYIAAASPPAVLDILDQLDAAEARLAAVGQLTIDPSLESEWAHNGHEAYEDGGEPECPGCWAFALLRILDGTEEADR